MLLSLRLLRSPLHWFSLYLRLSFPILLYVPSARFIELHARSAFSFLEGATLPEDLASHCAELGQPAMAITDANGVYGAPRFHLAAQTLGIRALIGAEIGSLADPDSRYTVLVENPWDTAISAASSPARICVTAPREKSNTPVQPLTN